MTGTFGCHNVTSHTTHSPRDNRSFTFRNSGLEETNFQLITKFYKKRIHGRKQDVSEYVRDLQEKLSNHSSEGKNKTEKKKAQTKNIRQESEISTFKINDKVW